MRKYLLFVLFLCIHWVAIGQTLYDYRYWFDGDEETMQTGSSAVSSWQMNLDLQSLNDNMHTLYLQVKDTAGVWSSPMIRRFLKIPTGAGGNYLYWFDEQEDKATMSGNTIDVSSLSEGMHTLRLQYNGGNSPSIPKSALFIKYPVTVGGTTSFNYWFDSDATIANTISGSGESFIDVSGLEEGFHTIHVQFNGAQPSVPLTSMFIKYPVTVGVASSINYWFDSDATNIYTLSGSGENLIDISGLEDGFHTIHAQYNGDQPSVPLTSMFIKIPQTMGVNSFNCLFYVDGELHKQEEVSASEGIIKWDVDVSEIPHGLHRCQAIVMTPSGVATGIKESFFYRAMTTTEKQSMKCYYSIDNSGDYIQAGTLSENVYHFDLDVSSVSDGFHRISYMLLSDDGTCSKVMSSYFIKTPLGGDGIMQYDYWINDNDDNVHTTKLDARENPFKLITLLPVETCPIRSSCFDFNIVDGKPIVYAKNDFHIRFYDTAGRMTEATKNYIDENVSREVTSITEITGVHTTITTAKPANDSILWYKMNASAGDSIAIKSNQSCTINIFSASGKEVHSASGSDAVSFGGIYAYEDGTYYIAVHDAISSSSKDLELNFFQLNKYAIVDYDIHKVGNGGFSTITFNGNGYYSLDSISISRGDTIIPCVNIDRHSNTKVEATFDFGGIPNGDYDIKFLFQDDTINVSKGLYVEEAKDIELDFSVDHESVFYIGHEPYYNITVTNSGNSSAIGVPVYIYVETKLSDGIPRIKLSGLDTPSPLDGLDMSEYSASEIGRLKDLADDIGDNLNFMCYRDFDEESNDSVLIRANYFFVDIPPMTTKTIKVSIATTDSVECYAVVPDIWPTYTEWNPSDSPSKALALLSSSNNNAMDYFCCYHDRVECVMNFVAAGADFTSLVTTLFGPELATVTAVAEISSCVSSSISSISSSVASIFCSEEAAEGEKSLYDKLRATSEAISFASFVKDCGLRYVAKIKKIEDAFKLLNNLNKINSNSFGHAFTNIDCILAFLSKKPNCPPIPPDGGECNPINSYDPNDIYGYLSESGSRYVKKDQADLYYTIEFENDTAIATAAAHEVIITDTLDNSKFDLSSFEPTEIRIGDKVVELDGNKSTVVTVDMRPEIYTIAQMKLDYEEETGIAKWHFTSLDPMTLDPTDNPMSGFLPVNYSGNGMGEVSFNIKLKDNLDDGVSIENSASIVFDYNDPIITPIWTNIMDTIAPVSTISSYETTNDSTFTLHFEGSDKRSGIWKYELYVQENKYGSWIKNEDVITDSIYMFKGESGLDYGFCVLAVDSAGNVENKKLAREAGDMTILMGDVNEDGVINSYDASLTISYFLGDDVKINTKAAEVSGDGIINSYDAALIIDIYLDTILKTKKNVDRQRIKSKIKDYEKY